MRKMMLLNATCFSKSSWTAVQPAALPLSSTRPLMTKSEWTPPSRLPSNLYWNRASRIGPSSLMNDGTLFWAPKALATATCGFIAGEVPPVAGWMWQPPQLSRLKRGPRPSPTPSASSYSTRPAWKNISSLGVRPGSDPPAPASPVRTPGSL